MSGSQQSTMVKSSHEQQHQQKQQYHKHKESHGKQQQQEQYQGQQKTQTRTSTTGSQSLIRQNFSDNVEHMINQLINTFITNSYRCSSMSCYFDREDVALFGIANFHRWASWSDALCAKGLIDYMLLRGGCVEFEDIPKPDRDEWDSTVDSLAQVLEKKKSTYDLVLKIHEVAVQENDPHLIDFLEVNYIRTLADFNRKVGILIANARLAGDGVGEYEFNKDVELSLDYIIHAHKLVHQPGWERR